MAKRKRQKAARRRGRAAERKQQRRSEERAQLVYEPGTRPALAATILHEQYGDQPVELSVIPEIVSRSGLERARAIADAALARARDVMALSIAADVALSEEQPREAETLVLEALETVDDDTLHVRLAIARASRGQVARAIGDLEVRLRDQPGNGQLQIARGRLLEHLHGAPVLPPPERAALDRFADRTALDELAMAVGRFTADLEERIETFAGGLEEWIDAGACTQAELEEWTDAAAADPGGPEALRLRRISEWSWLVPFDEDDDPTPLDEFAEDESQPEELRRRARTWLNLAMWGVWEVEDPEPRPGVVLTDLLTCARFYVEVPSEQLEGLSRWSALVGCVVPVDGVWRMASGFEVASPAEARHVVHQFMHDLVEHAEIEDEGRRLLAWIRRVHDWLGPYWMPAAVELPSPEVLHTMRMAARSFAPHLVARLRKVQGTQPEEVRVHWFTLELDDPGAAWLALAAHPDFEREEEMGEGGLSWVPEPGEEPRGLLEWDQDDEIAATVDPDDLSALLEVLNGLGHRASAEELPFEPILPPVALPDLEPDVLEDWLDAWPDEPLELFDGFSPRRAIERHDVRASVDMLVRYLEHEADQRDLSDDLDFAALRQELDLPLLYRNQ